MSPVLFDSLGALAQHCWRAAHWRKTADGIQAVRAQLKKGDLNAHLAGTYAVGLAPIVPGHDTTRIAVLDFDSHQGDVPFDKMREITRNVVEELKGHQIAVHPFRSSGGKGIHLIMVWSSPQDAYSVRERLRLCLAACGLKSGTKGVRYGEVEIFPKQDSVPADGFGNMFVLPWSGQSVQLDANDLTPNARPLTQPLQWQMSAPVPVLEHPLPPVVKPSAQLPADLAKIRETLQGIPNDGVESADYDTWRNVGFAVHHATGGSEEGRKLFHEWSARSPKYDPEWLDERFWPYVRSDRPNAITERTLFQLARAHENPADEFEVLPPAEESALGAEEAASTSKLRTATDIDSAALLRPDYLLKGWLYRGANGVLFGEWNAGKTFVAVNMSVHVAAAMTWFGCRVKQAGVLYLTYEGARGFDKRVAAVREQYPEVDWPQLPFAWQVLHYPLTSKQGHAALQAAIKDFHARFGKAPGLVIIDPLADALGGDDSDAELMGKLNAVVLGLIDAYGCAVLRLHHSGHSDKTRGRGHSSLPASADTEIRVDDGTITATKQRDDGKGELSFKRTVVELGVDQDGDPVTTCIVVPGETSRSKKRTPKGKVEKQVLDIALELAGLGDDLVPVEAVLEAFKVRRTAPAPGQKDNRRGTARRALNELIAEGFVALDGDKVRV